ncbi:MoeA, N-terminal and linker domain-containing protein [Cladorrhinum samala]|uniref:molybdopterin adenylyltransferase n=1 Tax=Cladorrhinum samala TaxID=585594 RepID=A0AAV9HIK8_9PEZI|nr:MoeA, N-terminal and linker domain-containing protein [Cladorrhinum samala]
MTAFTTTSASLPLTFASALDAIEKVAAGQRTAGRHENAAISVPLDRAVGRTAARNHTNPEPTPRYDTSAMDGFAVRSAATANASPKAPVRLRIAGSIAAGDDPSRQILQLGDGHDTLDDANVGSESCVEIMTGGIFPPQFDACIKVEDVIFCPAEAQHILVTKPIAPDTNKRFRASDIPKHDILVKAGETIRLSHILPLASAGLTSVSVAPRPRVGILSTGKELVQRSRDTGQHDVNGPYLTAAATSAGAKAKFLGVIDDEPEELHEKLHDAVSPGAEERYDVVITSGAVSKGRHDHVRDVLEKMGAEIIFHGLAIRPGHPVLFALLKAPDSDARTAFFGLPGNPGAAAACFRFLVVPYLRTLRGQEREKFIPARLVGMAAEGTMASNSKCAGKVMDCFRHGVLSALPGEGLGVEVSPEQSPAKLRPYKSVNCWVHFEYGPGRAGVSGADMVKCYPFSPATDFPATEEEGITGEAWRE